MVSTSTQLINRCGWGSGALYFAEVLPNSKITAFSNSRTQKLYIDAKVEEKGLKNVTVITGNVVDYEFEKEAYDRVVSIEVRLHEYNSKSSTNNNPVVI